MRIDTYLATRQSVFSSSKNLIVIPNVSYGFFSWGEADLIAVTKNKYIVEGEIKSSLSDLKKDRSKNKWGSALDLWQKQIKRHYYIIPAEIYKEDLDIRQDSGIITYVEDEQYGYKIKIMRCAKNNANSVPVSDDKILKLCRLASFRFWDQTSLVNNKINEIEYFKKELDALKERLKHEHLDN